MSELFEIAYATASGRLCLFTGTGFSKAVSGNTAPSWDDLLKALCDTLPPVKAQVLKNGLFPAKGKSPLTLEEAAQVIAIDMSNSGKNIHDEAARIIGAVRLQGKNDSISKVLSVYPFRVATTNYDKLFEKLIGLNDCQSMAPGLPIPRSQARVKIFHVHGSIDSPANMVITSDDYFKFLSSESYFSRKLSTVLHENTVVILGYSLADANLKAILNDYRAFSRSHVIGSNIFFVSKDSIDQHVKDYYSHCYGIRVLDNVEIHVFFEKLGKQIPAANEHIKNSLKDIQEVLDKGHVFLPEYLAVENSFFEIISSVGAIGRSINDEKVVKAIGDIIEQKIKLTRKDGAWSQYEHLARWLVYLGTILDIKKTSIMEIYLKAVLHSMSNMSKGLKLGYSWYAFTSWKNQWGTLTASNRAMIRELIEEKKISEDALEVVRGGSAV